MSPPTPFPTNPEEVTSKWVEEMLIKNIPNSNKVKIVSLETESEDKKSGTLSTISRVRCIVSFDEESRPDENHRIFIKIMPKNERFRQFANGSQMDKTEIETYKRFLPEMQKFEIEKIGHTAMRISPRLYAGEYDLKEETRSWFVALEDLTDTHLMPDFGKGLTLNQLTLALEKLAHFHALTYSYGKSKGIKNFEEEFDFFNQIFKNFDSDPEVSAIINESMLNIKRDLKQDPNLQHLIPKLDGFREKMNNVFATLVQRKDADVVIHGDIWANNYLFSRSDDNECFMVDWQFTSTGNPLFDFGPVAFLSMNPEETESNLDSIMKSYFNHYKETCLSLGLAEDELLWKSFDDFESEAKKVGLYITFVWSVISYEVVKMYPPMRERYLWVLKTSCHLHPELFNNGSN